MSRPDTMNRLKAIRADLWTATNRRQTKIGAQIEAARSSLNYAMAGVRDGDLGYATERMRAARRQLIQALVMTRNYDTATVLADALIDLDRAYWAIEPGATTITLIREET